MQCPTPSNRLPPAAAPPPPPQHRVLAVTLVAPPTPAAEKHVPLPAHPPQTNTVYQLHKTPPLTPSVQRLNRCQHRCLTSPVQRIQHQYIKCKRSSISQTVAAVSTAVLLHSQAVSPLPHPHPHHPTAGSAAAPVEPAPPAAAPPVSAAALLLPPLLPTHRPPCCRLLLLS